MTRDELVEHVQIETRTTDGVVRWQNGRLFIRENVRRGQHHVATVDVDITEQVAATIKWEARA